MIGALSKEKKAIIYIVPDGFSHLDDLSRASLAM
jgi:hypothetical protein